MTGAAEPLAALQRRLDAFLYMFGTLEATAATSPAVRDALLTAIRLAETAGYVSPAEAVTYRGRLDQLQNNLTGWAG